MQRIVKNLTTTNIANTPIIRRSDLDFSDDGTNFRVFEYHGLPLSITVSNGIIYLAMRWDYINHYSSTKLEMKAPYDLFRKTESYKLTDKYNGTVKEFDLDELMKDCDKVIADIEKVNVEFENMEVDPNPIIDRLEYEISHAEINIYKYRSFPWWNAYRESSSPNYDINRFMDFYRYYNKKLEGARKVLKSITEGTMEKARLVELSIRLENYHYVHFSNDDFYKDEMNEMYDKYSKGEQA